MQALETNSNLTANLMKDLLDFGQHENKKFRLNNELVHLKPKILDVRNVLDAKIKKKKLKFEYEVASDQAQVLNLAEFYVDQGRLKQILINLTSNAIKFSPPGERLKINASLLNLRPVIPEVFENTEQARDFFTLS